MSDIENQIIDKLKRFNEIQQRQVLEKVEQIEKNGIGQGIIIAVTVDGIDCQIQCISPERKYPDALFTPAGVDLVDAIVNYVDTKYKFRFGRVSGKMMLSDIGSAIPLEIERTHTIKFSKDATEYPDLIEISSVEVQEAIAFHLRILIKNIREHIEKIVQEFEADSEVKSQATISLRGEFRQLRGLDQRIQEATGLKVIVE